MYKCTTAISTAENWNSAHWTAVTVTDEIKENAVAISSTQPTTEEKIWIKKGKNLFDKNTIFKGYIETSSQKIVSAQDEFYSCYAKVNPNTVYTVSKQAGKSFRIATTTSVPINGTTYNNTSANHTGTNITITTGANDNYICVFFYADSNGDTGGYEIMANTLQVEQNSTATTYEPYVEKEILVKNENNVFEEFYNEENINQQKYSLGETKIGTWIDGKSLYRKVVNFGELPNNTTKEISHNISNIDKIIRLSGYAYRPADGFFIPIPQGASNNTACSIFSNSTKITITTYTDRSLFTECYIVIEYTKTTD